jgi:hypothetical protein
MIKQFDSAALKTLRFEIDQAMKAISTKHGISLSIGNIRYDSSTFTTKLTAIAGDNASAIEGNAWTKAFMLQAEFYGMKKTDLGKAVVVGGKPYTIAGFRPKANDQVVLKKATGGHIAASVASVTKALALNK